MFLAERYQTQDNLTQNCLTFLLKPIQCILVQFLNTIGPGRI
jgi:hypothetical protein